MLKWLGRKVDDNHPNSMWHGLIGRDSQSSVFDISFADSAFRSVALSEPTLSKYFLFVLELSVPETTRTSSEEFSSNQSDPCHSIKKEPF